MRVMFSLRKGQKSLEMIIGLVILLVVAGVVISTFLNQFQDNPGSQYEDTLQQEEIKRTCQSKCSAYKSASGIRAQTAAIDYCTSTFNYDADGDGTLSETAGRLYNSYCEDGVKCFNIQTCEIGRTTLDAERCKEVMQNYYTSSEVGLNASQAESRIAKWYQPNGEGQKTIGSCNLDEAEQTTWYSSNFGDLEVISDDTVSEGDGGDSGDTGDTGEDGDDSDGSNEAPTADFAEGELGQGNLDASLSSDPDGSISELEVRWDFGNDGSWDVSWTDTRTDQVPSACDSGEVEVKLQVRDSEGATDSKTKTVCG